MSTEKKKFNINDNYINNQNTEKKRQKKSELQESKNQINPIMNEI